MRIMIYRIFYFSVCCLFINLAACSSNPPAPVIDRLPADKSSTPKNTVITKPSYKAGDWRPDTYVVKKGDNLFGIGLEFGYYYKDIAQANNIVAPYNIRVGQVLKLKSFNEKVIVAETKPRQTNSTDGVEITPIHTESSTTAVTSTTPSVIRIAEPKAIREPYSEEALKKPLAKPIAITSSPKPTGINTSEATNKSNVDNRSDAKKEPTVETKSNNDSPEDIDWAWPTKGKVIANFNEASNKGLDIAGTTGQAINAAGSGKVIYSGSDLRGYGKLVIIKHNATYLSVYAHNSQILVKEGQQISRGQKIAEMGNSDSHSVKLHFEIRRLGKSVDPSKYLAAN